MLMGRKLPNGVRQSCLAGHARGPLLSSPLAHVSLCSKRIIHAVLHQFRRCWACLGLHFLQVTRRSLTQQRRRCTPLPFVVLRRPLCCEADLVRRVGGEAEQQAQERPRAEGLPLGLLLTAAPQKPGPQLHPRVHVPQQLHDDLVIGLFIGAGAVHGVRHAALLKHSRVADVVLSGPLQEVPLEVHASRCVHTVGGGEWQLQQGHRLVQELLAAGLGQHHSGQLQQVSIGGAQQHSPVLGEEGLRALVDVAHREGLEESLQELWEPLRRSLGLGPQCQPHQRLPVHQERLRGQVALAHGVLAEHLVLRVLPAQACRQPPHQEALR
mmetsp:Transcript_134491/g.374826  ORF Transcript_134491/g.374826 Transcript_134491/m.374826 type:complete len:325 (+) Transcript_134491:104-1078(+)